MHAVASAEIDAIPADSVEGAVRYVVLGTVLMEPVLLALRRLAEADASGRRFARPPSHHPPGRPLRRRLRTEGRRMTRTQTTSPQPRDWVSEYTTLAAADAASPLPAEDVERWAVAA